MIIVVILLAATSALGVLLTLTALLDRQVATVPGSRGTVAGGGLTSVFVPLTDRLLRGRGDRPSSTLVDRLAQADVKLRPSEFLLVQLGCAGLLATAALLRFGLGIQVIVFGLAGYVSPLLFLAYRRGRRQRAISEQLPDTLALLSSGLKAGYSFPQAIDNVSRRANQPTSDEFARVVREMQIGRSPEQALVNLVRRVESEDMDLVITAVVINSQVGGNLARILDSIQETIRERVRVEGQIAALTAQARASGIIITGLPFAVALLLYFVAPAYFQPMLSNVVGWVLFGLCLVSIAIGNVFVRRIARIDV